MALRVEVPDLAQGQDEDDDVGRDVRDRVPDEEMLRVDAFRFRVDFVPEPVDGVAGEDGDDDDGDPPGDDDALHDVGRELEFGDGEDAAVEGEDGEFDGEDGGAVEEFVGEEALVCVVRYRCSMFAVAGEEANLEVFWDIFEGDGGDVFSGSEMGHFHGKGEASEGEDESGETHVIVEFKPQLLYPPGYEATDDCYDGEDGEGDCGFQGNILLTLFEIDIGRWCGHFGG